MADWVTISSLATAGGTLVLAAATFAAVRSSNRAARVLYGDYAGGQRFVSRFGLIARDDGGWLAVVSRHWNIDRAAPR